MLKKDEEELQARRKEATVHREAAKHSKRSLSVIPASPIGEAATDGV